VAHLRAHKSHHLHRHPYWWLLVMDVLRCGVVLRCQWTETELSRLASLSSAQDFASPQNFVYAALPQFH
jgi:hypothetical protein